jgi:hypothetical protein
VTRAAVVGLTLALLGGPASAAEAHLLIVSGLGGEPRLSDAFHEWAVALKEAAGARFGLPPDHVRWLAEKPERDPARIDGKSTRENVGQALAAMADAAGPADLVLIVLIGHGSFQGGEARFNLPGPDMTPSDFARLLEGFHTQRVAFVNTASASGEFIKALSGPNRAVVTATRSGMERNETVFGRFFTEAFAKDGADVDKDDRVSLLEAFEYARRHTARFYAEAKRLATEHPVLDDDGDGVGSGEPGPEAKDGALARTLFLARGGGGRTAGVVSERLRELRAERRRLEEQVEALKAAKGGLDPERYQRELEDVLLRLARTGRAIREEEAGR